MLTSKKCIKRLWKYLASSMRPRLKIEKKAKQRESSAMEDPIIRKSETLGGLNLGWNKTKKNKPHNGDKGKCVTSVGANTLAHAGALWAYVLDVET